MGKEARVRLFIYNNDFETFKRLIQENVGNFTHYVIISHFYGVNRPVNEVLEKIPRHQLLVLDKKLEGLADEFTSVYQDFGNDIQTALSEAKKDLAKYEKIHLVFPQSTYHSTEIKEGFKRFCAEAGFAFSIMERFTYHPTKKEAYIILEVSDLLALLNTVRDEQLELGKEIGVISYNETPLKEFIAGGLTVISTDFAAMGTTAGKMIKSAKVSQVSNPFRYIRRQSL